MILIVVLSVLKLASVVLCDGIVVPYPPLNKYGPPADIYGLPVDGVAFRSLPPVLAPLSLPEPQQPVVICETPEVEVIREPLVHAVRRPITIEEVNVPHQHKIIPPAPILPPLRAPIHVAIEDKRNVILPPFRAPVHVAIEDKRNVIIPPHPTFIEVKNPIVNVRRVPEVIAPAQTISFVNRGVKVIDTRVEEPTVYVSPSRTQVKISHTTIGLPLARDLIFRSNNKDNIIIGSPIIEKPRVVLRSEPRIVNVDNSIVRLSASPRVIIREDPVVTGLERRVKLVTHSESDCAPSHTVVDVSQPHASVTVNKPHEVTVVNIPRPQEPNIQVTYPHGIIEKHTNSFLTGVEELKSKGLSLLNHILHSKTPHSPVIIHQNNGIVRDLPLYASPVLHK